MSERLENLGVRHDLMRQRKNVEAEARSHRDSMRATMPMAGDVVLIDGDYVVQLAIALNEKLEELKGICKKLEILNRELGM